MNLAGFIFSWEAPRKQVRYDYLGDQQLDNNPFLYRIIRLKENYKL